MKAADKRWLRNLAIGMFRAVAIGFSFGFASNGHWGVAGIAMLVAFWCTDEL